VNPKKSKKKKKLHKRHKKHKHHVSSDEDNEKEVKQTESESNEPVSQQDFGDSDNEKDIKTNKKENEQEQIKSQLTPENYEEQEATLESPKLELNKHSSANDTENKSPTISALLDSSAEMMNDESNQIGQIVDQMFAAAPSTPEAPPEATPEAPSELRTPEGPPTEESTE